MATLKDAELAREQTAEHLRQLGAHAISVEEELPGEADGADAAVAAATATRQPAGTAGLAATAGRPPDATPAGSQPAEVAETAAGTEPAEGAEVPGESEPGGGTRRRRRRTFAVVAWFAGEPPADLPRSLEIRAGTRKKLVPLRARRAERFRAE